MSGGSSSLNISSDSVLAMPGLQSESRSSSVSSVNRLPKVIKDHKKDSHSRAVVPSGSMSARGTRDLERGPTPDGSPLPIVPSQNQPGQSSVTQELHLHDERQRMDYTSTTNELHMHDSRQQSVHASVSNELRLHDDRQQTVQIGISPHEYGQIGRAHV